LGGAVFCFVWPAASDPPPFVAEAFCAVQQVALNVTAIHINQRARGEQRPFQCAIFRMAVSGSKIMGSKTMERSNQY
jgi:hypothetical protein